MIKSFKDDGTEDVFNGKGTTTARRICPEKILNVARRKLAYVNAATSLQDLSRAPGNRLEKLAGDRQGQYSIRISGQYRICFVWTDGDAEDVEITDYH